MRSDIEYCFGHQEKESKMKTICRKSMPLFESLLDFKLDGEISFSIESAIPLGSKEEDKEQYAHSLPYKLESNKSISKSLSGLKDEEQHPSVAEKKENKTKDKTIVLEVKPLRLNQQIDDVKNKTQQTKPVSKVEEKDNVKKISCKDVSNKDVKFTESKEKKTNHECTKKSSLKSISKQEAPKQIIRSKGHDDENVQMKFMKTTYEDPVQCNDINRMAPVKINSMNVEPVKIKDGK